MSTGDNTMLPLEWESFHEGVVTALRMSVIELAKKGIQGEAVEAALISSLTQVYELLPGEYCDDAANRLREMMRNVSHTLA